MEVFQISLRKGYGIVDLKSDLSQLYVKTGQKGVGMVFLLTDAQVGSETARPSFTAADSHVLAAMAYLRGGESRPNGPPWETKVPAAVSRQFIFCTHGCSSLLQSMILSARRG